jgi:hypothetical protein
MRWVDRIHRGDRPARFGDFLDQYASPDERERLAVLSQIVDSDSRLPDPARLASEFQRLRQRWRAERRRSKLPDEQLPPLNGVAG